MFATITARGDGMQILELSQGQIEAAIFAGATSHELRSPLEGFSEEEILALPRHTEWNTFDMEFRNWIWQTIHAIMEVTDDYS